MAAFPRSLAHHFQENRLAQKQPDSPLTGSPSGAGRSGVIGGLACDLLGKSRLSLIEVHNRKFITGNAN